MIPFNGEKVRKNAEQARTEDLLDRVTVYRNDLEPEALEIIERELARRGVTPEELEAHAEQRRASGVIRDAAGLVRMCCRCRRPAVEMRWGWQRLFGFVPIFPRLLAYCSVHQPSGEQAGKGTSASPSDHFGANS
jgi:hypothetical protein